MSPGGSTAATSTIPAAPDRSVSSPAQWCALYRSSLPALTAPNPDGNEAEHLEKYVAHYALLAKPVPAIPLDALELSGKYSNEFAALFAEFESGTPLPDLLAREYSDPESELWHTGTELSAIGGEVCADGTGER